MKNLIALVLAMVCMMSLVACGYTKQESVVAKSYIGIDFVDNYINNVFLLFL